MKLQQQRLTTAAASAVSVLRKVTQIGATVLDCSEFGLSQNEPARISSSVRERTSDGVSPYAALNARLK